MKKVKKEAKWTIHLNDRSSWISAAIVPVLSENLPRHFLHLDLVHFGSLIDKLNENDMGKSFSYIQESDYYEEL